MRYTPMVRLALTAALVGLATPATAHAQFGKLIKKAKHAMDPATSDSAQRTAATDGSTRRPAEMVELTSARVSGLIDGLQAKLQIVSAADGIGVAAMNARAQKIEQELPAIDPEAETRYDNAVGDQRFCMEKTRDTLDRAHEGEARAAAMQMATDRQRAMQMGALLQKAQEARARGDTAEATRLQRQMMAPMLAIGEKDSLEAIKRCGQVPIKPADLVKYDSLTAAHETLIARIRAVQIAADSVAAERSGMTRQQFEMAKERVLAYVAGDKHGLDTTELAALDARHDEIMRLSAALYKQGASW
ncbi:MAG TPA: hypothetical protein VFK13_07790 [Gemmatimonadaceae bacterium]|nr:hypothetical protein [Gemmatimonadaceae bacterium]